MARDVYKWPPVDAIGTMWTVSQPINQSRSFFTGADYTSSAERKRHVAQVIVPGIGDLASSMCAGYCEVLKDLLAGGQHFVRLQSMPVNWYFDQVDPWGKPNPIPINWTKTNNAVAWTKSNGPAVWLSNEALSGTKGVSDEGWHTVTVTGVAPNALVARPAEYVRGFALDGLSGTGTIAKVLRPAYSDASGVAVIYLMSELADTYHVELNAKLDLVFRIDGDLPSAVQPVDGNWSYQWDFREVFSDEVEGGFNEVDPW